MANPQALDPGTARRHPVATLFLSSGTAALIVAVVDVVLIGWINGIGRVRKLELFRLTVRWLERWNIDVLSLLPAWVSLPFNLSRPLDILLFLSLAIVANFLLLCVVAALLSPLAALALGPARRRLDITAGALSPAMSSETGTASGRSFVDGGLSLAALLLFCLPGIESPVHYLLGERFPGLVWLAAAAIGTLVWLALGMLLGSSRLRRLARAQPILILAVGLPAAAGAATALAAGPRPPAPVPPVPVAGLPNVLLISVDSLRADHVHCEGYARETTPAIDSLAREGALFRTVLSPVSWTLPAHLSLLTALPPEAHGVIFDRMKLQPGVMTLAEVLRRAGYETAGFASGPYLEAEYGFSQGFRLYDDYTVPNVSPKFSHRGITSPCALAVVRDWLESWDRAGRRRPFFVFLHLWDVHYDYAPPPPYDSMFDPDYRGTVTGDDYIHGRQVHRGMDPRDLEHVIALYDGEIRFTDLHIGLLVEKLRGVGALDRTITVVTSDHGEEFFEHGNKGHRRSLYDESLLVPLVIRFPSKVPAGTVVAQQVRLTDIAPTVLALAGVPQPQEFGTPAPKGQDAERDLSSFILDASRGSLPSLTAFADLHGRISAVRTGQRKLIRYGLDGREEVFDLGSDPGESENLIGRDPRADESLRATLVRWREKWRKGGALSRPLELNEEQKERLRSLGYVD